MKTSGASIRGERNRPRTCMPKWTDWRSRSTDTSPGSLGAQKEPAQRRAYSGSAPEPDAPKNNVPLSYDAGVPHAHSQAQVRDPYRRPLPRPRDHMPRYVLRQGGNSSFNPHTQSGHRAGLTNQPATGRRIRRSPPEQRVRCRLPRLNACFRCRRRRERVGSRTRLHGDIRAGRQCTLCCNAEDSVFQQLMATRRGRR